MTERRRDPNGHRAFLGVAENDGLVARPQPDVEVDRAPGLTGIEGAGPEGHRPFLPQYFVAAGGDPGAGRAQHAGFARLDRQDLLVDDRRTVAAVPDVVPLGAARRTDGAVPEPEGAVMRMVTLLPFRLGHRPVAGQRLAARSVDRVEVRQMAAAVRSAAWPVLGEGRTIDGDQDAVATASLQ